jgi:mannosyltransferase
METDDIDLHLNSAHHRDEAKMPRDKRLIRLSLALIIATGAAVRICHIGTEPFWIDEMYSVWFSQRSLRELWTLVPHIETHSPLFYTALKCWTLTWGSYSAWSVRSLSCIASVLCIPVAYRIVAGLSTAAGRQAAGLAAAGALALDPVQIVYAQDARPYALLTLAVGIALLGLGWLYENILARAQIAVASPAGPTPHRSAPRGTALLVLVCGLSVALWLHNTAVLLVGVTITLLSIGVLSASKSRAEDLTWLALTGAAALVVWSPNAFWVTETMANPYRGSWLQPPTLRNIAVALDTLVGSGGIAGVRPIARAAVSALLIAITLRGLLKAFRASRPIASAAALVLCVPLLCSVLVSWTVTPIFLPRTMIWIAFAQAAAIGWFVALGRPNLMWARAGLSATVAGVAILMFFLHHDNGDHWPAVVKGLRADHSDTSLVVFVPNFLEIPIRWYGDNPGAGNDFLPMPAAFPALGWRRLYPSGLLAEPSILRTDVPVLAARAAGKQSVWLVSRFYQLFDPESLLYKYLLCSRGEPLPLATSGSLGVWRYGPILDEQDGPSSCLASIVNADTSPQARQIE